MRLTLRTLLSYLDEVHLSDQEREAIRQQIEASENAGEWIHRTRDVMRRLKVGAPEIEGSGSADDPNSVAEYLDRTLPDESVAEFERVCLESDPLLAEVASCHHVLAMFLAEPLAIDPDTRQRLHRLQADLAEATQARIEHPPEPPTEPAPEAAPEPTQVKAPPRRRKAAETESHVPGYLRERAPADWKRWAPAIAALLLLAVTAGIAFLPGGPLNPREPDTVAENEEGKVKPTPPVEPKAKEPEEAEDPEPSPEVAVEPEEGSEGTDRDSSGEAEEPSEPAEGEAGFAGLTEEEPMLDASSEKSVAEPIEESPPEPTPTEEAAEEPLKITYQSEPTSLGVYELLRNSWRRLERGFEVAGPTRVISLPNYRNSFELGAQLALEAVDLTDFTLSPPGDAGELPQIELAHGRLLMSQAVGASAPAVLDLVIDGTSRRVAIEPGAVLAIRAERLFQPGWVVEESSPQTVAVGDTLAGVVEWTTGGTSERVPVPKGIRLSDETTEPLVARLGGNEWVERLSLNQIEEAAAAAIAGQIVPGKPVWPQLRTIASKDKFKERRALAALASAAVGHPDSLIESFTRSDEREAWARNLTWLRQTASHDPLAAKTIRRVFGVKVSPQAADGLMDLMVGFTPKDIGSDPAGLARGSLTSAVIPALESSDVATRVLGSLVFNELVTGAEGVYDPSQSARRRAGALKNIRYRLEDGDLKPRVP